MLEQQQRRYIQYSIDVIRSVHLPKPIRTLTRIHRGMTHWTSQVDVTAEIAAEAQAMIDAWQSVIADRERLVQD